MNSDVPYSPADPNSQCNTLGPRCPRKSLVYLKAQTPRCMPSNQTKPSNLTCLPAWFSTLPDSSSDRNHNSGPHPLHHPPSHPPQTTQLPQTAHDLLLSHIRQRLDNPSACLGPTPFSPRVRWTSRMLMMDRRWVVRGVSGSGTAERLGWVSNGSREEEGRARLKLCNFLGFLGLCERKVGSESYSESEAAVFSSGAS